MKCKSLRNKGFLATITLLFALLPLSPILISEIPKNQEVIIPDDNVKTSQIIDGLIINYTFSVFGMSNSSGFTYSHYSGEIFNVSWWIKGSGYSTWNENKTDRVISNSAGPYAFLDGSHASTWINTTVNILDVVLISADGVGDFPYQVAKEFTYNLAGFGAIEVWQLDNLIIPGFHALYEKSTGILVKGIFPLFMTNYTLEITDINTDFNIVEPITGIFDGLYIKHNMTMFGVPLPSNFTYHEYEPDLYNASWSIMGSTGTWNVIVSKRRMINIDPFGPNWIPGTAEVGWIHTNVSLNDIVPIAVDGAGNFPFQIIGETTHDLIGFGKVGIWVLRNTIYPNATVWYEKSTGILIKGTFVWGGGNYTFDFIDTNAHFEYITPAGGGIPGYNIVFLVSVIGIFSLIVTFRKRKR
jgi:hypothetical protein